MQTGLSYLRENLKKLPLDIREAIVNTDYLSALEEIQETQKLHIDQAASMEELTFKLMLGELDTKNFGSELSKALNIDSAKTNEIVMAVDQKVMQPIREEIQRIEDENLLAEDAKNPIKTEEGSAPENYADLKSHEILAEIENPQPSIVTVHQTTMTAPVGASTGTGAGAVMINKNILPSSPAPILPTTPANPPAPAPTASQPTPIPTPQMPSGWPTPPTPPAPTQTAPNPTSQIAATYSQKLEQTTVSKPVEVRHSIDPYKEPVE